MTLIYISPSATIQVRAFLALNGSPSSASPYTLTAGADNGVSKQHSITPLNSSGNALADGTRAAKLDTVALTTDLTPIATSAQVTTAQNAILTQGNVAWTTATAAGLGLPAITTAIAAIPTQTLASGDPALIATAVKAALDAQLDKIIDLNEADVVKTLTTYVKNRRGTQTPLFPSKTVSATGDNVSIRQL